MNKLVNPSDVGERLRELRGDYPRTKVAKEMGISYSALSKYEDGRKMPSDQTKVMLANYYGVSVSDIFFDEE